MIESRDVIIDYTNHRGERSERRVMPLRWEFQSTEWHATAQWVMWAFDTDKLEMRGFAMCHIHSWRPARSCDVE